ncbi:hypothetical protein [Xenorhabdus bovienii]|uniref:hypothetical protein n=1 Tax=Xenorhabdus bovienii TaxID=40576 RepID=UPI0023B254B5|nr:hypothetical protein [Xenorhabdus bovienii]MDE9542944.1 hypothetical protein [Xenorhabdus bovienii]
MKINNSLEKINYAIKEIDIAISVYDSSFNSFTTLEQLNLFKTKLLRVLDDINLGKLPQKTERNLGISRIIVDQWPFDNILGGLIIEAEQVYKNI